MYFANCTSYSCQRTGRNIKCDQKWWSGEISYFITWDITLLILFLLSTFLLASGPGTPDSIEGVSQHLSPESSRKAYCRTWEQPSQSASFTHMPQSPNVFNEHMTNSTMSPGTAAQSLKSPASIRSRSVSDSSVPQRGNTALLVISSPPAAPR